MCVVRRADKQEELFPARTAHTPCAINPNAPGVGAFGFRGSLSVRSWGVLHEHPDCTITPDLLPDARPTLTRHKIAKNYVGAKDETW